MQPTFRKLDPARQEAILDAAAAVFAERGYRGANIPVICEAAHVSTGALYKYFRNKEALFRAVLDRGVDIIQTFYDDITPGEIFATIARVLEEILPLSETFRPYLILYIDIGGYSLNTFADYVSERFEGVGRDFFFHLVEAAKARGEVAADIESVHAAYLIDSYVILYAYALVSEHYRRRFDRFFERLHAHLTASQRIDLIMQALRMFLT
ncbi:MAG TPA: TetR/AcrR family transcriptional regulator [Deltaproteobacteria bacterium]|nr:TetR/AcrR family transcriptional regulator [Deltaproteobacteria bacterium]